MDLWMRVHNKIHSWEAKPGLEPDPPYNTKWASDHLKYIESVMMGKANILLIIFLLFLCEKFCIPTDSRIAL